MKRKIVSFQPVPAVLDWLEKMKAQGRSATWAINNALTRIAALDSGGAE